MESNDLNIDNNNNDSNDTSNNLHRAALSLIRALEASLARTTTTTTISPPLQPSEELNNNNTTQSQSFPPAFTSISNAIRLQYLAASLNRTQSSSPVSTSPSSSNQTTRNTRDINTREGVNRGGGGEIINTRREIEVENLILNELIRSRNELENETHFESTGDRNLNSRRRRGNDRIIRRSGVGNGGNDEVEIEYTEDISDTSSSDDDENGKKVISEEYQDEDEDEEELEVTEEEVEERLIEYMTSNDKVIESTTTTRKNNKSLFKTLLKFKKWDKNGNEIDGLLHFKEEKLDLVGR